MEKETRNRIQRATQAARTLLEHEYSEQLEGIFDIRLNGSIAKEPGDHLDAKQLVIRHKLIAAVEHHHANGLSNEEAVAAYLRETAFTTLNRFVALKMLEVRELVQECISRGDQSAGFKEFSGLAPGLVHLADHGYHLYIESLFDEIGREVRVLFDRRDSASLLWPRRQTIQELLVILNAQDLATVWNEDETIGWVYQYFNGEDERKKMRDESQAPRNSRELAVRNQFFTPRYVIQLLVDNTLGRTWFEMMGGETKLKDLDYLIRRQHEVFLDEDQELPEEQDGITFGEMPDHPFPVPFRKKKDPRDLKILDPACGSGHFLLYTFDLLLTIYEEGWSDEEATPSRITETTLRGDYSDLDSLRLAAPELILRHNLHGIEIDPRAAQIASLALWMRAQRVFQETKISRSKRPAIVRTDIVIAECMPGEADLRKAFIKNLEPKLAELVEHIFKDMELAGEAGYLLRIKERIEESIQKLYPRSGELFIKEDKWMWEKVAGELRNALESFVNDSATESVFTRELFAGDATSVLGFIDICSQQYDVILMNPPFGEGTESCHKLLTDFWPNAKRNLYIGFVYRAFELIHNTGMIGAITDSTFVHQTRYEKYRRDLLDPDELGLHVLVANGWGVLDAYVETACIIVGHNPPTEPVTIDIRKSDDRAELIRKSVDGIGDSQHTSETKIIHRDVFSALPKSVLTFWLPNSILDLYHSQPSIDSDLVDARCGMSSSDNPRFYKVWWEVSNSDIGESNRWRFLANGGPACPLFRQQIYVVNWSDNGRETKARVAALYGSSSRTIINEPYYFRPGLTFSKRTESFTSQFLPEGGVFSNEGQAAFPHALNNAYSILAYLNSSMVSYILNSIAGQHKEAGYVGSIPSPHSSYTNSTLTVERMRRAHQILLEAAACIPESQVFHWPLSVAGDTNCTINSTYENISKMSTELKGIFQENDKALEQSIGISTDDHVPWEYRIWDISNCIYETNNANLSKVIAIDYISYLLGHAFGRWEYRETSIVSSILKNPFQPVKPRCPALRNINVDTAEKILVDDPGHVLDISSAIESAHNALVSIKAVAPGELQLAQMLMTNKESDLRILIRSDLFQVHIERYSKSRRKAPIYWHLATPTASYSIWLYYHQFTRDTFFRLLNDHVVPKLQHEERKLTSIIQDVGPNPTSSQRKEIEDQDTFIDELRTFRDEVEKVAPLWNPNLNDGVILNFAPLWRLVPHNRSWQGECKKTWEKLCKGDYDWTKLAIHLWPERVVPKCADDRSLAISHDLEEIFWYEDEDGKWHQKSVSQKEIDDLVADRTSPAVKDALKTLQEAPSPTSTNSQQKRKKSRSQKPAMSPKAAKQNAKTMNMFDEGESS